MKKRAIYILIVFPFLLLYNSVEVKAQEKQKTVINAENLEEEDEAIVFRFEPNLLSKNEQRKAEISEARKTIDTLDISDRKRYRLLKKLYRNAGSQRSKKALLADVKFEDVEE